MTTQYNRNFGDTLIFSDTNSRFHLLANAVLSYTVPGNSYQYYTALFEYASDSNVFVGYNVSPTIPAAGTKETTGIVEYKPFERAVKGGDVLYFITPDTVAYFGVSFRAVPSAR